MNKEPAFILLAIIILVGLAWDPIKKGGVGPAFINSGSSSVGMYGEENSPYSPPTETSSTPPQPVSEQQVSRQISKTQQTAEELKKKLEEEQRRKSQSPYYGKVSLSYISSLNDPDPSREYMTLYTNLNENEKVNITGWKLQSERTGNWVKIGKASTLPFPFTTGNDDIILQSGATVYLIKGFSPIGISFRTNKCTGYFGENRTFYPYLGRMCPNVRSNEIPRISSNLDRDDECRDLISRVPVCTTAEKAISFRNLPDTVTRECKDYLRNKFTYNTCVSEHFGDTDFPGREWYVYMNVFGPLWRDKREKITLYDTNGLIVSSISY